MPNYSSDFLKSARFALREEIGPFTSTAGYVSAARAAQIGDRGGETLAGVARAYSQTWPGWLIVDQRKSEQNFPNNLNLELPANAELRRMVQDFYFFDYWETSGIQRSRCDVLPWPLSFVHFDCTVNVGNHNVAPDGTPVWHGRANAILQVAAGVKDDGYIGPLTLAAIAEHQPRDLAIKAILEREHYYKTRGAWADGFRKGWLIRTKRLLAALALPEGA